jgi:hypothetical protein
VDRGNVSVEGIFVALSRGQVDAAADLLVEEGVLHGVEDEGVHAQGKFPEIPGTGVGVQQFIDPGVVVGCRFHDLPVFDDELRGLKNK